MVKIAKKLTAAVAAAAMCFTMLPALSAGAEGAHTITVTTDGNGTASSTQTSLTAGESYTLTATPNEGYVFDHWEISDDGSGVGVKKANISFVIDKTGSMSSDIKGVAKNLKAFISEINSMGIATNVSVIDFKDVYEDGDDSTVYNKFSNGSYWTENTDEVYSLLENISKHAHGGGDSSETPTDAFSKYYSSSGEFVFSGSSVNNYIFLLTDAGYKDFKDTAENRSKNRYPMTTWINTFKNNNIRTSVVSSKYNKSKYSDLCNKTGGKFFDIDTDDYYKLMLDYAKFIGDTAVTVNETYASNPCTVKMPDCNIIAKAYFKKTDAASTYNIKVVTSGRGTAYASTSKAAAGEKISIFSNPESGWLLDGISSDDVSISENTFTMPAKDVTVNVRFVEDYSMFIVNGRARSYIFSYDESGKLIATNSTRKYDSKIGTVSVTVKLGTKYAGRSCVLYTGKSSSGGSVVDEAVLDEEGKATFTVEEGENFHLLFSE